MIKLGVEEIMLLESIETDIKEIKDDVLFLRKYINKTEIKLNDIFVDKR